MKNKKNQDRMRMEQRVLKWETEISSGRHDGWVTGYFKKKIRAVKDRIDLRREMARKDELQKMLDESW